jgi:hypothetical protein
LIWLKCCVPEGSTGELHWALHAWSLLDRKGFSHARLCFTSDCLVSKGVSRSSAGCYHHMARFSRSVVKSVSGEGHVGWDLRTSSNGGSDFCGEVELAWSWLWAATSEVGGDGTQEKFKVLPCRVKIQGLALIGCACQWSCWRHCFCERGLSLGWKS